MVFFHQIAAALLLVTLTLWLQCGWIATLISWVGSAVARDVRQWGPLRSAVLVVRVSTAEIAVHGLQVLLWACCYRWLCFPSWDSALYFSASSYATVGYGDVVLPPQWRMLGPLESIIGVLMCGLSVSFLFAVAMRLISSEDDPHGERAATSTKSENA